MSGDGWRTFSATMTAAESVHLALALVWRGVIEVKPRVARRALVMAALAAWACVRWGPRGIITITTQGRDHVR